MASRRGMMLRTEAAEARIDAALAAIVAGSDTALPERPARHRDTALGEARRAEWIADVLERIAAGTDAGELEAMTVPQLTELAERVGAEPASRRKADIIAAIRAAERAPADGDDTEGDDATGEAGEAASNDAAGETVAPDADEAPDAADAEDSDTPDEAGADSDATDEGEG